MGRARRLSVQQGAAIVETLFAVLFLAFMMFGIVELARAWFTQQLATAAVREAVRAGAVAVQGNVSTAGVARIDAVLTAGGIPNSNPPVLVKTVALQPACTPGGTDRQVVANVTVRFSTVFPLLLPILGTLDIPQSATMRWEDQCAP